MVPATFAELSLGIWLLVRARGLPGSIEEHGPYGSKAPV
jgi:hypothetical protein